MKPMLAGTLKSLSDIKYPVICTPKLDGIRCLIINGLPVTRSLKPIPNRYIHSKLSGLPEGLDGEIMLRNGGSFQEVSSAVRSEDGEPDFIYCVFDIIADKPYYRRLDTIFGMSNLPDYVMPLIYLDVRNEDEFLIYEEVCLEDGAEGVMLRDPDGPYKHGRSTASEGFLLKWKRFEDAEAVIIGFEEMLGNNNKLKKDALGHAKRSSHKENLVPKGTLGALVVQDLKTDLIFKVGTGFDADLREEIWKNRGEYAGQDIKYKHQPHGRKNTPRFPVFQGFRMKEDMS